MFLQKKVFTLQQHGILYYLINEIKEIGFHCYSIENAAKTYLIIR